MRAGTFDTSGAVAPPLPNLEQAEEILERADRDGGTKVDPLTLNPHPVVVSIGAGPAEKVREMNNCWNLRSAPPGAPAGAAVECFHRLFSADVGDGRLATNPNSVPDTWLSGFSCPTGFPTLDQLHGIKVVARFFDAHSNLVGNIRHEIYDGTIYNGNTGKSAHVFSDDVWIDQYVPADGTGNNDYAAIFGNDFSVSKDGQVLARTSGVIYVDILGNILLERGPHPNDDYFTTKGDFSGLLPVCNALA